MNRRRFLLGAAAVAGAATVPAIARPFATGGFLPVRGRYVGDGGPEAILPRSRSVLSFDLKTPIPVNVGEEIAFTDERLGWVNKVFRVLSVTDGTKIEAIESFALQSYEFDDEAAARLEAADDWRIKVDESPRWEDATFPPLKMG